MQTWDEQGDIKTDSVRVGLQRAVSNLHGTDTSTYHNLEGGKEREREQKEDRKNAKRGSKSNIE